MVTVTKDDSAKKKGAKDNGAKKGATPGKGNAAKKPAKKKGGNYDASAIQVLKGLDAVRKRPGMYIGGTGNDGLHHLLWELIDNGVDEAAGGHADRIDVELHDDRSISVADNGRGIPIDIKGRTRKSALELVFTELHAGGKFGGGAYSASGGLHGVGASVVNALSTKLVAEVDRDGQTHRLTFVERVAGKQLKNGSFKPGSALEKVKKVPAKRTGTRVRFWPDFEVFDPDADIDYDVVRERVQLMCHLVPGMKITLTDHRSSTPPMPDADAPADIASPTDDAAETVDDSKEVPDTDVAAEPSATKATKRKPGETETFVSKGGLADLVDSMSKGENVTEVVRLDGIGMFEEKVPVDGKMTLIERACRVDVAMRWVTNYETKVVSFVNTIPTSEGGTHVTGWERAMNKVANDVLLNGYKKLSKLEKDNKHKAGRDDVQEGLVAAIKVTVAEPQFRGQTKGELGTPAVQSVAYDVVKTGFTQWCNGGGKKTHINALRDKLASAVINRVASKDALDAKRKAASLGSAGMPPKLADCRYHGPDSELLIVEGDSAAGPAKKGRDSNTMAVLPIRGKMVNAGKANLQQVVSNSEAQDIITAIGSGSGRDFDLSKCRYGRIILLCDADVDGSHIRCLILTLIYHHLRPLLEDGRVFAAQPPLYSTKVGKTIYYALDEDERLAIAKKLKKDADEMNWVRFKGLGEMDVHELAETTLDRESRVLRRITMEDAKGIAEAGDLFETLMGSDVARRKDWLLTNSDLIDPDSLDI